jgi:hypothetical protein
MDGGLVRKAVAAHHLGLEWAGRTGSAGSHSSYPDRDLMRHASVPKMAVKLRVVDAADRPRLKPYTDDRPYQHLLPA